MTATLFDFRALSWQFLCNKYEIELILQLNELYIDMYSMIVQTTSVGTSSLLFGGLGPF